VDLPKKRIGSSLIWLVVAGILPIIAFSVGVAWRFIDQEKAAAEAELGSTARALMVAVDRELASQVVAMQILATAHSLDGNDLDRFRERARRVLAEHPAWLDIVLVDPVSKAIVAGPLPIPTPAPMTSAPAAVDEAVATGKPVIVGAFPRGKIIAKPMILLAAPVVRAGIVRSVMIVIVDQSVFSDIFTDQRLPSNWTGAVVDAGMRLAGRSRDPGQYVGRLATPSAAARIRTAEGGLFEALNQEGDKVYTGFSRSSRTGWSVIIGIPAAEFEGPMRRTVVMVAAAGAALVTLALVLAGLVGRAIIVRRRAYEEALEESEGRYSTMFTNASAIMLLLDPTDGAIVDANLAASQFYGYDIERLKRMHISDINILSPEEIARVMATARDKGGGHFNLHHQLANGEIRDVDVHAGPLTINGRCLLLPIIHDITERKQAEAAQKASEERMRLFFERQSVGMAITSPEKGWLQVNDRLCRMLGYSRDELDHLTWAELTHPADLAADQAQFERLLAGEINDYSLEKRFIRKDGSVVYTELSVGCVRRPGGSVDYVLALLADITGRKMLERELQRSNAELEQFASVASHDLRQPLRMVSSYLSLAERRLTGVLDDDTRQFMDFALDGAKRMDHLIIDLLEYSRTGRHATANEPVSLRRSAEEAVQNLGVAIEEAKAEVVIAPDLPTIQGYPSDLVRLFQNLIGNAVKYRTPDRSPSVAVTCRRDGKEWIVSVRDNGIGIPADQRDRVFGLFQRLHAGDQYEGTGIGLAVCRKIVEHHGGRIHVESVEGEGSDFQFTLPVEVPEEGVS